MQILQNCNILWNSPEFKPTQIDELYIYNDKNERVCSIRAIDKVSNSKMKRNEKISMYRGGLV